MDVEPWFLSTVYGPTAREDKADFLQELRGLHAAYQRAWLVCGDFNLIHLAQDKNNGRLNLREMRRFRAVLQELELAELHLNGRLFTWSNERRHPTLERIDRAFAVVDWLDAFPAHHLKCLSSDCSDHAPLFLILNVQSVARPRFRFAAIWIQFDGFLDVVKEAWSSSLPNADAFRALDHKLRRTAVALKRWSSKRVGSIRFQLAAARAVITELDTAQDFRQLSEGEAQARS